VPLMASASERRATQRRSVLTHAAGVFVLLVCGAVIATTMLHISY
jgi:hypothetical protein